jgi:HlyD family secretion protein
MDRDLDTSERARHWLRRGIGVAAVVGLAAGTLWLLPAWLRLSLSLAEIRTAVVDRGTVEAVLVASGTISDVHAARLAAGMPVRVVLDDEEFSGRLTGVHPTIDNGAVRFNVALDDPRHGKLRQKCGSMCWW